MPHRFALPSHIVNEHRSDAVMLLRIAAGVNAMEASLRLMLSLVEDDDSPAAKLGRAHSVFAAVGYLREIVKMIEREGWDARLWQMVDAGVSNGFVMSTSVTEARALLSPTHPDIGGNVLLKVRNKIGFHWDPQPFEAFLDDPDVTEAVFVEFGSEKKLDRIFRAAADAMSRWFLTLSPDRDTAVPMTDLIPAILAAHGVVGDVVEAAIAGMLAETGDDPADYLIDATEHEG